MLLLTQLVYYIVNNFGSNQFEQKVLFRICGQDFFAL